MKLWKLSGKYSKIHRSMNCLYSFLIPLFFSLLFLYPALSYGYVIIQGTVINSDGILLPQTEITSGDSVTQTDDNGVYGIYHSQPGTYDITASKDGYDPQTKSVTLSEGETAGVNFNLAFAPLQVDSVSPNWLPLGAHVNVNVHGKGFSRDTRVTIALDSGNSKHILGSIATSSYAQGVTLVGNLAYVPYCGYTFGECGLEIIDITSPLVPDIIGSIRLDAYQLEKVAISGDYCYVATNSNLTIIDVNNPRYPILIRTFPINANAVKVFDNIAFITDDMEGLTAVDVTNPYNLSEIDSLALGKTTGLTVSGNYAYVIGQNKLHIVNIADPSRLFLEGSVPVQLPESYYYYSYRVAVSGGYAYVAAGEKGVHIVDVGNPASPTVISSLNTSDARDVFIINDIAYIADRMKGLLMFDVTVPQNPEMIGRVATQGAASGIAVSGSVGFMAAGFGGFQVIDVADPSDTITPGFVDTSTSVKWIAVNQDYAYIEDSSHLQVVDIRVPSDPKIVSSTPVPWSILNMTVAGNYAYAATGPSGLQIINISDPENPVLLQSVATGHVSWLTVHNNYIYVGGKDLLVIDITDPSNPETLGAIPVSEYPRDIVVSGSTAYVVDSEAIHVVDVSNPFNPTVVKTTIINESEYITGIDIQDDVIYLRSNTIDPTPKSYLTMYDISSANNPQLIKTLFFSLSLSALEVENGVAYLAHGDSDLEAWDVSNPSVPIKLGSINTLYKQIRDVSVVDGVAYLAAGGSGLACLPVPTEVIRPNPLQDSATQLTVTVPALSFPGDYNIRVIDSLATEELRGALTLSDKVENAKAIIVAGYGPGTTENVNWLWDDTVLNANYAYKALIYQGYRPENIRYLSAQEAFLYINGSQQQVVWGDANLANFEVSIRNWAKDADDVVVYLVDHGGPATFKIKIDESVTEILNASELAYWLNDLQDVMTGRLLLVYEACKSGSFLQPLMVPEGKNYNRILLTSSASDQDSFFGNDGRLSFAWQFWATINENAQIDTAFNQGFATMKHLQQAWMDTNGNGIPNEISIDKITAKNRIIGRGWKKASDNPTLNETSGDQTLVATASAVLWAEKPEHLQPITKVWAVLIPPDYNSSIQDIAEEKLISVDLIWSETENRYQASYNRFNLNGEYTVLYYAMDDEESISLPKSSKVIQAGGIKQCDFNLDGTIDLADEILVLQILADLNINDTINAEYDANLNGKLDIADAVYVLHQLARQ